MNGSRSSKYSDIAFVSDYTCAEWNDETECDFVGSDIEVVGSSEYVIGDRDYFDRETFYVPEFKCPKCGYLITDIELKVG
jgi:hypothetical protein